MRGAAGQPRKALLTLEGVPLVRRSIDRLLESGVVTGVVVAAHADDRVAMAALLAAVRCADGAPIRVVAGGATRQASCEAGLTRAAAETPAEQAAAARVLFHDAARPLVTAAEIRALVAALESHPVAVLATPVTQTLKRAGANGEVEATVPRERLFQAQTPQGFRLQAATQAFARAAAAGFEGTDDVALAEFCQMPVKIVAGSSWNIKVTTPEDLDLAQAILKLQGRT